MDNLEWITKTENQNHAWENGLQRALKGEECSWSKLKEGEVWLIKKLLSNKVPGNKIAKMFKVCKMTVSLIKQGKNWKN